MSHQDDSPIFHFGDAVKALGDGRVGGYVVRFGSPAEADCEDEFFTPETDYGLDLATKSRVVYHHGLTRALKAKKLGYVELALRDEGIWGEGPLDVADRQIKAVYADVEAGKLGWSSGSTERLVERKAVKGKQQILTWPLAEVSLTPRPVDPRNKALAIKAMVDAVKSGELGEHAGHWAAQQAMDALHGSCKAMIAEHMRDPKKTRAAKHAACKACLDAHATKSLACIKALMDDDHQGDDDDGAMKARRARLEHHARLFDHQGTAAE
jgi:phage head maturation protease